MTIFDESDSDDEFYDRLYKNFSFKPRNLDEYAKATYPRSKTPFETTDADVEEYVIYDPVEVEEAMDELKKEQDLLTFVDIPDADAKETPKPKAEARSKGAPIIIDGKKYTNIKSVTHQLKMMSVPQLEIANFLKNLKYGSYDLKNNSGKSITIEIVKKEPKQQQPRTKPRLSGLPKETQQQKKSPMKLRPRKPPVKQIYESSSTSTESRQPSKIAESSPESVGSKLSLKDLQNSSSSSVELGSEPSFNTLQRKDAQLNRRLSRRNSRFEIKAKELSEMFKSIDERHARDRKKLDSDYKSSTLAKPLSSSPSAKTSSRSSASKSSSSSSPATPLSRSSASKSSKSSSPATPLSRSSDSDYVPTPKNKKLRKQS